MPRAFIIRPFNVKKDSAGKTLDFERVHKELIEAALDRFPDLKGATTGEIVEPGNIREDMFAMIIEADLVICDITIHNANVFYELGLRHALRKKRTVLLKGAPTADGTPFDILTDRYVAYKVDSPADAVADLIATIEAAMATERPTDSPVFKMLPGLAETDPATIQVLPLSFREEVGRARAAKSIGWLRLLAHEVRGRRFERIGLQHIAQAQWELKDYDGARESFEQVRETMPHDEAANLALANIYERLSRSNHTRQLLDASDQAIDRVLTCTTAASKNRVEALTLKGRNSKTRWRRQLDALETVDERRAAAMNQALRISFDAYRAAFQQDLNHFYSGLAALQMAVIFLDLATPADGGWKDSFDSDKQAIDYRSAVESEVAMLPAVVGLSIDAALGRLPETDPDRVWAKISAIDLLFLSDTNAKRLAKRYTDVLPPNNPFAWDAALGQLQLYASLGVRAPLAEAIIDAIEAAHKTLAPPAKQPQPAPQQKPLHVVVFAGHQPDSPPRIESRFPATLEPKARDEIRSVLVDLSATHDIVALASGAPGGDLIFHEVCQDLGITSSLCLPMPANEYVKRTFADLGWRARFVALFEQKRNSKPPAFLELSDTPALPKWLTGSDTNEWERGNRWVCEMALATAGERTTLIALWDGKRDGSVRGGTAHMVSLAEAEARVRIHHIDTTKMLQVP